jgi:hypothetical protein
VVRVEEQQGLRISLQSSSGSSSHGLANFLRKDWIEEGVELSVRSDKVEKGERVLVIFNIFLILPDETSSSIIQTPAHGKNVTNK